MDLGEFAVAPKETWRAPGRQNVNRKRQGHKKKSGNPAQGSRY